MIIISWFVGMITGLFSAIAGFVNTMGLSDFIQLLVMITGVVGLIYTGIQFKKGTEAQQDARAPLLIINSDGDKIAGCQVSNIGSLFAKDIQISLALVDSSNAKHRFRLIAQDKVKLTIPIIPTEESDGTKSKLRLFSLTELSNRNTDKIVELCISIKYKSPLHDRIRSCSGRIKR